MARLAHVCYDDGCTETWHGVGAGASTRQQNLGPKILHCQQLLLLLQAKRSYVHPSTGVLQQAGTRLCVMLKPMLLAAGGPITHVKLPLVLWCSWRLVVTCTRTRQQQEQLFSKTGCRVLSWAQFC